MGFLKNFFGNKNLKGSGNAQSATTHSHFPSPAIAFLSEAIHPDGGSSPVASVVEYINYATRLYSEGRIPDSVRCLNAALARNPSCSEEIVIHRNYMTALYGYLGLGSSKSVRNFDFCYVAENLFRHLEAIIGLYASNESTLIGDKSAEFLRDTFDLAMNNYMPMGLQFSAYEENGVARMYESRVPQRWRIAFVSEPKNALSVNGAVFPQHILPK